MHFVDRQWKAETRQESGEMDSVLLIGQSNMAGRGIIGSVPEIPSDGRRFMLRNGCWQPMTEPVNPDRRIFVESDTEFRSGVSLAPSFAQAYTDAYSRRLGLIPCADGGTMLVQWQPGELLFDHAVMMTKLAMRTSRLAGILWHQGESDSRDMADVAAYEFRFMNMLDSLLEQLDLPEDFPVVIGGLSEQPVSLERWPFARECNDVLRGIARKHPNIGFASAEGLAIGPDRIHFDGPSYREFGRRYFAAYQSVVEERTK